MPAPIILAAAGRFALQKGAQLAITAAPKVLDKVMSAGRAVLSSSSASLKSDGVALVNKLDKVSAGALSEPMNLVGKAASSGKVWDLVTSTGSAAAKAVGPLGVAATAAAALPSPSGSVGSLLKGAGVVAAGAMAAASVEGGPLNKMVAFWHACKVAGAAMDFAKDPKAFMSDPEKSGALVGNLAAFMSLKNGGGIIMSELGAGAASALTKTLVGSINDGNTSKALLSGGLGLAATALTSTGNFNLSGVSNVVAYAVEKARDLDFRDVAVGTLGAGAIGFIGSQIGKYLEPGQMSQVAAAKIVENKAPHLLEMDAMLKEENAALMEVSNREEVNYEMESTASAEQSAPAL